MKKILLLTALLGIIAAPAIGQNALGTLGPGAVPCAYTACTVTSLVSSTTVRGGSGSVGSPTFASSGDTNTGFYFNADHTIRISINGSQLLQIGSAGQITSVTSTGFAILNTAATATAPTVIPNQASATTGWGGVSGTISGVIGGVEDARFIAAGLMLPTLATGTNADFVCYKSDGTLLIQASACTISSMRFKTEIKPYRLDVSAAVLRLPVVTFRLKNQEKNKDPNSKVVQMGLLAEDVAKILPLCAIYENDMKTPKSYRQECLLAALVKTVQEQHAANDSLARRVAVLERRR